MEDKGNALHLFKKRMPQARVVAWAIVVLVGSAPAFSRAQAVSAPSALKPGAGVDYRSAESLNTLAGKLRVAAQQSGSGLAAVTLDAYAGHMTMLTVRVKSGQAEQHNAYNDVFMILDGEAAVLTGGTIPDGKEGSPGEIRGTRVQGGVTQLLRKGDVIHIAPGTPHQIIVDPGKTFVYYVVKVADPKRDEPRK